jgi:hypothetical protein
VIVPFEAPQAVGLVKVVANVGIGLTVIGTLMGKPIQVAAVVVTVYVKVTGELVVFVKTSEIDAPEPPAVVSPVTLPFAGVDQEKVVPATLLVNETPVALPEQIVCGFGIAVATGVGFTVTGTLIGNPTHVAAVGVTV